MNYFEFRNVYTNKQLFKFDYFACTSKTMNMVILGVLISSVIIKIWPDCKNADPICTVLFSIIVVATTVRILRDTLNILLESNVDSTRNYDTISNDLFSLDHVVKVHDLHIWSLTTDQKILTVHLAVDSSTTGEIKS